MGKKCRKRYEVSFGDGHLMSVYGAQKVLDIPSGQEYTLTKIREKS